MHTFTLDKPDNLIDWWQESAAKFADRKFLGTKNKDGLYEWVTYREVNTRIDNLRAGLAGLGVGPMTAALLEKLGVAASLPRESKVPSESKASH